MPKGKDAEDDDVERPVPPPLQGRAGGRSVGAEAEAVRAAVAAEDGELAITKFIFVRCRAKGGWEEEEEEEEGRADFLRELISGIAGDEPEDINVLGTEDDDEEDESNMLRGEPNPPSSCMSFSWILSLSWETRRAFFLAL